MTGSSPLTRSVGETGMVWPQRACRDWCGSAVRTRCPWRLHSWEGGEEWVSGVSAFWVAAQETGLCFAWLGVLMGKLIYFGCLGADEKKGQWCDLLLQHQRACSTADRHQREIMSSWKRICHPLVGKSHTQAQRSGIAPKGFRGPPESINEQTDEDVSLYDTRRGGCLFFKCIKPSKTSEGTQTWTIEKQDKTPETNSKNKRKGGLRITYQRIKNNRSSKIYKKYGQLNEFGKIMHEQHENINK